MTGADAIGARAIGDVSPRTLASEMNGPRPGGIRETVRIGEAPRDARASRP